MPGQKGALSGTITRIQSNGSWNSSQGGTFFSFKVDLDGDDPLKDAEYNQKNETAKYKVGDKISFDKQVDDKGRVKLKNHAIDSGNAGPSGKGSSYNDPIEIKRTAMSMAQQMAVLMYYKMNEGKEEVEKKYPTGIKNLDVLVIYFFNWIVNIEPITREGAQRRAYAVERAIALLSFQGMVVEEEVKAVEANQGKPIKDSERVLLYAQHLIDQQVLIV